MQQRLDQRLAPPAAGLRAWPGDLQVRLVEQRHRDRERRAPPTPDVPVPIRHSCGTGPSDLRARRRAEPVVGPARATPAAAAADDAIRSTSRAGAVARGSSQASNAASGRRPRARTTSASRGLASTPRSPGSARARVEPLLAQPHLDHRLGVRPGRARRSGGRPRRAASAHRRVEGVEGRADPLAPGHRRHAPQPRCRFGDPSARTAADQARARGRARRPPAAARAGPAARVLRPRPVSRPHRVDEALAGVTACERLPSASTGQPSAPRAPPRRLVAHTPSATPSASLDRPPRPVAAPRRCCRSPVRAARSASVTSACPLPSVACISAGPAPAPARRAPAGPRPRPSLAFSLALGDPGPDLLDARHVGLPPASRRHVPLVRERCAI